MRSDAQFEDYLRQFRPRAPRPLPAARASRWIGIAAAALFLMVVSAAIAWLRPHSDDGGGTIPVVARPAPERAVSLASLHALAALDSSQLELALDREARGLLPDVERGGGVLQALSAR